MKEASTIYLRLTKAEVDAGLKEALRQYAEQNGLPSVNTAVRVILRAELENAGLWKPEKGRITHEELHTNRD